MLFPLGFDFDLLQNGISEENYILAWFFTTPYVIIKKQRDENTNSSRIYFIFRKEIF